MPLAPSACCVFRFVVFTQRAPCLTSLSSEALPQTDKWTPQLAGDNAASQDVQESRLLDLLTFGIEVAFPAFSMSWRALTASAALSCSVKRLNLLVWSQEPSCWH